MKNNKFFWIIAAVVIAALALTGCPPESKPGPEVELEGITVTPAEREIIIERSFNLKANPVPENATLGEIVWTSDDPDYVTVDSNGRITGVKVTEAPVKVHATSKANSSITAYCEVTVIDAIELKLSFIPSTSFTDTPPELPDPDANVYAIDAISTGNWATASGFDDVILVYPDRVLKGDFRFRARIQLTNTGGISSASKGLIVGAFKGATEAGDFASGGGKTLTTGINLRLNNALRNYQSRNGDNLAAVGLNITTIHDKMEEYIYEVIRDENGITTNMYVSKSGDKLTQYSSTSPIPYTNSNGAPHIQADTPVYAGIALAAAAARISQIALWEGDLELEDEPIFYTGNSTPAPVAVTGISVTVKGEKGNLIAGPTYGTSAKPAEYYVTETAAGGSLELEAVVSPAYADILGATFPLSTTHTNDSSITVNDTTGVVTITGTSSDIREATIEAISIDPQEMRYYLTIIVTPDYVPVDNTFAINPGPPSIDIGARTTLRTNISPAVTNPVIIWSNDNNSAVKFIGAGNTEVDTFTGPSVTVIGKVEATNVTITAAATTTNGTTPTTINATKTIAVTVPKPHIWEWKIGDSVNSGSNNSAVVVNDLLFNKGGGTIGIAPNTDNIGELILEGSMKMTGGARWTLGLPATTAPSTATWVGGTAAGNGAYASNAELDLSRKYKLTVKYVGNTGGNADNGYVGVFSASLNTNTGGNGAGPVIGNGTAPLVYAINGVAQSPNNWSNATLFNVDPVHQSANTEVTLEVTVDPAQTTLHSAATAFTMEDVIYHQFIQFRCDSTTTPLWITYIKLEYVVDEEEDDG